MAEREQKSRSVPDQETVEDAGPGPVPRGPAQADGVKADLDDLLDEIDEVLETNAEDFVKSYIQKGGE